MKFRKLKKLIKQGARVIGDYSCLEYMKMPDSKFELIFSIQTEVDYVSYENWNWGKVKEFVTPGIHYNPYRPGYCRNENHRLRLIRSKRKFPNVKISIVDQSSVVDGSIGIPLVVTSKPVIKAPTMIYSVDDLLDFLD